MFTTTNSIIRHGISAIALAAATVIAIPTDAALAKDLGSQLRSQSLSVPNAVKAAARNANRAASAGRLSIDTSRLKGAADKGSLAKRAAKAVKNAAGKAKDTGSLKGELASRLKGSLSRQARSKDAAKPDRRITAAIKDTSGSGNKRSQSGNAAVTTAAQRANTTLKSPSADAPRIVTTTVQTANTKVSGKGNASTVYTQPRPYNEFEPASPPPAAGNAATANAAGAASVAAPVAVSPNKMDAGKLEDLKELGGIDRNMMDINAVRGTTVQDAAAAGKTGEDSSLVGKMENGPDGIKTYPGALGVSREQIAAGMLGAGTHGSSAGTRPGSPDVATDGIGGAIGAGINNGTGGLGGSAGEGHGAGRGGEMAGRGGSNSSSVQAMVSGKNTVEQIHNNPEGGYIYTETNKKTGISTILYYNSEDRITHITTVDANGHVMGDTDYEPVAGEENGGGGKLDTEAGKERLRAIITREQSGQPNPVDSGRGTYSGNGLPPRRGPLDKYNGPDCRTRDCNGHGSDVSSSGIGALEAAFRQQDATVNPGPDR